MTEQELDAIAARAETARVEVNRLCDGPHRSRHGAVGRKFTMTIPRREDDSDSILYPVVACDVPRLVAEVRRLQAALQHMRVCASCAEEPWSDCEGGRDALAALGEASGETTPEEPGT